MRKISVNKLYSSIPNCHTGKDLKLNVSGCIQVFFHEMFTNLQEKLAARGTEKIPNRANQLKSKFESG